MSLTLDGPVLLGIGTALCVLWALALAVRKFLLPRPIPGIPYKKISANRILGDAPDIIKWKEKTGEMWDYVRDIAVELNSPIVQVFMRPLGKPWVVVTDFKEAQDIQVNRQHEFDRSKFLEEIFRPILPGNHTWMPTGEKFRYHRWLIRDTMSAAFLRDVVAPAMHDLTEDMFDLWREKIRLAKERPFTVAEDMIKNMVDVILKTTFGIESLAVKTQLDLVMKLQEVELPSSTDLPVTFPVAPDPPKYSMVRTIVNALDIGFKSPFPKQALTIALNCIPSLRAAVKWKEDMMTEQMDAAWTKFAPGKENDDDQVKSAIDLVIQREAQAAEREKRAISYDNRAIRDEIFGAFAAGHETSSTTVCWAVKRLTQHLDVQQKLRAALMEAYPRAVRDGTMPTAAEMVKADIPYLEAFVQENFRHCTTIPAVIRMATRDTVVLGHVIPKGTDVFMMNNGPSFRTPAFQISDSLRSPTLQEIKNPTGVWDDADIGEFKPERWLVRGVDGVESFDIRAGPSLPWGLGLRACFGMKLATLEIRMLVTMLLWTFFLDPIPQELSGFEAADTNTHRPQKVFLKLREVKHDGKKRNGTSG